MATQTVEFRAASGLTLTVRLFAVGSDTIVQTASSCTEATNRKGTYAATFTDPGAAEFELVALSGTTPVARWFTTLTLTTATFQAYEVRTQAVVGAVGSVTNRVTANTDQWGGVAVTGMPMPTYTQPTGFLAATFPATVSSYAGGAVASVTGAVGSVSSPVTVGTNNDKTGYSLTQAFPTNFSSLAITVGGAVTAGTVSDKTGYSLSSTGLAAVTSWAVGITGNITGNVSGSVGSISGVTFPTHFDNLDIAANGHVTATVDAIANNAITASSIQANAITAAKIATDAIGAAQLAADAVTEIQSGLATAANLLIAIDRVSYCLSALAGACSDAQTAAETYVLSIGGNTYTVDYSGLDASGNRGTTTLTKA